MRRRRAQKRRIDPDPRFNDLLVAKLINIVMERGKKSIAEKIVYQAFDIIKEKTSKEPLEVFHHSVDNIRPLLETKSIRLAGRPTRCRSVSPEERGQSCADGSVPIPVNERKAMRKTRAGTDRWL